MNISRYSTDRIARTCLYLLIGLAVVVYALFLLVGYDTPSLTDASFNAPLLTMLLIGFIELVLAVALVVAVWMGVRSVRVGNAEPVVNGIARRRIALCVAGGTLSVLLLAFALGSASPLVAGGVRYTSGLWLKAADMFIVGGIVLVLAAIATVVAGAVAHRRKRKEN